MELTNGAKEILTQAQMLRLSTKADKLCMEHILYGMLMMASYLEEPLNKNEYRNEAKKLREFLSPRFQSIASAKQQLKKDAGNSSEAKFFVDAGDMISKAERISGGREINAEALAKAMFENPSPTIRALCGLRIPDCLSADAMYPEGKGNQGKQQYNQGAETVLETPVRPAARQANPAGAKPQQAVNINGNGNANGNGNNSLTDSQALKLLEVLIGIGAIQENAKKNRRTKIGLITYKGGPVAAMIQYFLLGILIPAGVLWAIEHFTGAVRAPQTPWAAFGVAIFVLLSANNLIRGVSKIVGIFNNPFSHFINIMTDIALTGGIAHAICYSWQLDPWPKWIRIVSGIICVLILFVGRVMFLILKSEADDSKVAKIEVGNVKGTPSRIFFATLTRSLYIPCALFFGFWLRDWQMPAWSEKVIWYYAFFVIWWNLFTMFRCIALRKPTLRPGLGKVFSHFLMNMTIFMMPVALLAFTLWLFGWHWAVWMIIICVIYGIIFVPGCFKFAIANSRG